MPISNVQFISATAGPVSSLNVVFGLAVSSGNLIAVNLGYFGTDLDFVDLVDNQNAGGYTFATNSTNTSDTRSHLAIAYKTNISTGAGASTYRVSVNWASLIHFSLGAAEYSGGPFTAGSTASSNGGPSTLTQAAPLTASSTPALFIANASLLDDASFRSTIVGGTFREIIDPTNLHQIVIWGDSTNSSLTQQPQFKIANPQSTIWLHTQTVFMGAGAGGGGGAAKNPWLLCLTGVQ